MVMSRIFRRRNLALLALLVLVTGAVYGFAATNDVPPSAAGDGYDTISGYNVTAVTYNLNTGDPTLIDSVTFNLAKQDANAENPTHVKAKLVNPGNAWSDDCSPAGTVWTCDFDPDISVVSANELRVVAVQ
jgi:hypothetical protein